MADPTFEEWQAKNATNPAFLAIQGDLGKQRLAYAATYAPPPGPSWGTRAVEGINAALATGRRAVQPFANQIAATGEHMLGAGTEMGMGPFGSPPVSAIGNMAAQTLNPMPADLQDLGGLAANIGVNAVLPGATIGRMALRPLLTAAGSALGGAAQGTIDPMKVGLAAAIPAAFEMPGFVSRMRAGITQRPLDNAAAGQYLSEASGSTVPGTPEGIAAARQKAGAGSLEEPMWTAYRQKFHDAITLTQDRPVTVTTGKPGEARMTEMIPLSQAWDRMSSLGEFYEKRRMMDEILTSLRTPLGGPGYQIPASPAAADLIAGANEPVRRTMSALELARDKNAINPVTGDVNMAAWQDAHQRQLTGAGGSDIPTSLQDLARRLVRRRDPTGATDQPGNISGLESGRVNVGGARENLYMSPFRIMESRFPKLIGVEPPAGWSGVTPAALGGTYGSSLGAMPSPDAAMTTSTPGPTLPQTPAAPEEPSQLMQMIDAYLRRQQEPPQ